MFGQYKRLKNRFDAGVLTGKGLSWGGSLRAHRGHRLRPRLLRRRDARREGHQLRRQARRASPARVTSRSTRPRRRSSWARPSSAVSDSSGYVVDEAGIDVDAGQADQGGAMRGRVSEYAAERPGRRLRATSGSRRVDVPCDVALPVRHAERGAPRPALRRWSANGRPACWPRARTCPRPRRRPSTCRTAGVCLRPRQGRERGRGGHLGPRDVSRTQSALSSGPSKRSTTKLHSDHGQHLQRHRRGRQATTATRATT